MVTKEDLNRVVRGPADLEEQIDQLKARVKFLQGKCRQAGKAILNQEVTIAGLKRDIDRLDEENTNLRRMMASRDDTE